MSTKEEAFSKACLMKTDFRDRSKALNRCHPFEMLKRLEAD